MLFWIILLIAVISVAVGYTVGTILKTMRLNSHFEIELKKLDEKAWEEGFNAGWNALSNDYSALKSAIKKLEDPK